jgi:cytochrome c oxidase assembly protein subunit 15
MIDASRRLALVGRLAAACSLLMLLTVAFSAYMRLSQAGLGCADWPACYGQFLRDAAPHSAAVGSSAAVAAARLAHRVVATGALVLALLLVLTTLATQPRLGREGRLAAAILALAVALSVLGVFTPGSKLPAVAMGNQLGGFALLALSWRLAGVARGGPPPAGALRTLARAALLLAGLQVALGALISSSFAALACQGLADCSAAASATGWSWRALDPWQVPVLGTGDAINPAGALPQLAHRALALVLLPLLAVVGWRAWRAGHRPAAAVVLGLTVAQATLGWLAVPMGLPIGLVLAHNLAAALLVAQLGRWA